MSGLHRCVGKQIKIVVTKDPDGGMGWPEAEAARRKKGATSVSANEYDFSNVPEDELLDCIHYEYARESATIIKEVEALRSQIREARPKTQITAATTIRIGPIGAKFTTTYSSSRSR